MLASQSMDKPVITPGKPIKRDYSSSSNVKVSPALASNQTFDVKRIKREEVRLDKLKLESFDNRPKVAFVLHNVFTKEECDKLIEISEAKGYEQALVNMGSGFEVLQPKIRNNSRTIIDDIEFAKLLWERISTFIPSSFQKFKAIGVNERLRFLRYDPGEKFAAHVDGAFQRDDTYEISKITLQIYLNQDCGGGATTFIGPKKTLPVQPKTGSILVFEHRILHEGSKVTSGRKYTVRTEVMYTPE